MIWWIPKNKFVKFMLAVLFVCVAAYLVGLAIIWRKANVIKSHYRNTESRFSSQEKVLKIKSIAESYKEEIQTLRRFFTQKGDEVEFIEQIESVGRASGVKFKIDSIDISKGVDDPVKEDVLIKISFEGSWLEAISFVDSLEKMPFGTSVINVRLDGDKVGGWRGGVDVIVFREK